MQVEIQYWVHVFLLLSAHWGQNMWKVQYINTKISKHNVWSHCWIVTLPNHQIQHENKTMLKFPKGLFSPAFITNATIALSLSPDWGYHTSSSERTPAPHFLKHTGSTGCDSTPVSHIVYHLYFFSLVFFFTVTELCLSKSHWLDLLLYIPSPLSRSRRRKREGTIYPLLTPWNSWPCTASLQPMFLN